MQKAECRMQKSLVLALSAFCLLPSAFAADKPGPDGFLQVTAAYEFEFPRDHGSHDGYRTEWWYYTGHLRAENGHRYGFELTFFRVGVSLSGAPAASPAGSGENRTGEGAGAPQSSSWDLHDLALAHFAITDVNGKAFRYYEKL